MRQTTIEIKMDAAELEAALARAEALVVRMEAAADRMQKASAPQEVNLYANELSEDEAEAIAKAIARHDRNAKRVFALLNESR